MATFDYTNRDYSTIRESLLERASRSIPDWTDRDPSDFTMALVDLWAYAADVMHYYIDRAATEAFLPTATQPSSVLAFANLYGYVPNPVSAATAYVTVENTGASVIVPSGTKFISKSPKYGNIAFYSTSDVIAPTSTTVQIPLRQGTQSTAPTTLVNESGSTTSDGFPGQRFYIYGTKVDVASIKVYVGEGVGGAPVEWLVTPQLAFATSSESAFTISYDGAGRTQVVFGDGLNGRIPPVGTTITATFATCDGASGNVEPNTITSINSSSFPAIRSITNPVAASGGRDHESAESIKNALPSMMRVRDAGITLSDFVDLALGVPSVAKSTAVYTGASTSGASVTVYALNDQDGYTTASASSIAVPSALRNAVQFELLSKAMLGITTVTVPATVSLTQIYINVTLYVKNNYIQTSVTEKVNTAILKLFEFSNVSFNQTMTIGDVYRAILAVEGVDYAVVTGFNTVSATSDTITSTSGLSGTIRSGETSLFKIGWNTANNKPAVTITAINGVSAP